MIKFLTDENVDPDLLGQLRRHLPDIDVIDVRDVGLNSTPDPIILTVGGGQRPDSHYPRRKFNERFC